jgi:hypothetical protein
MSRKLSPTLLFFALAGGMTSVAQAQTATMPPHATVFNGNTRGYWFTAPAGFRITGVQVLQQPGGTNGFMNWAVVRFHNATPPPVFNSTTNAFDQLGLGLGQPSGAFSPVSIEINAGDVIGIYGNTATSAAATTGQNSYTAVGTPATTNILGNTVNLTRSGMQFHLGSSTSPQGMHDIWTELTSTAISRVEFTYEPLNPNATGACCFTDGTCQFITLANCQAGGGNFAGENVTCAAANCPQPGACCMNDGTCSMVQQGSCASAGGTFNAGMTCAQANCPQPQSCCFFNGTCAMLVPAACAGQGGVSGGSGSSCATACPGIPPVVYSNCNLSTGAMTKNGVAAPAGSTWSECARDETDPTTANTTAGFGGTGALRLADDFVVGSGGMNLAYVKIPAYTTGATSLTLTGATLQIWNGPPNDPNSQVVFGDPTTNRLAHAEFSDIYRTFNTVVAPVCNGALTPPGTTRRIQWGYITVNTNLAPGTYWTGTMPAHPSRLPPPAAMPLAAAATTTTPTPCSSTPVGSLPTMPDRGAPPWPCSRTSTLNCWRPAAPPATPTAMAAPRCRSSTSRTSPAS